MKKAAYFMLVALLSFAACSTDEKIENIDNEPVELRLTSGIEVQQTRATHDLDQVLREGETIYVWVDDAETGDLLFARTLTVEEDGALTGGDPMYFPQNGNSVNIYALHTNADVEGTDYPEDELEHQVAEDQRSTGGGPGPYRGYAESDLVYARSEDVSRQTEAVQLEFKHLLSKIEVVLKEGEGLDEGFLEENISRLELVDVRHRAAFTLDKEVEADEIAVQYAGFGSGSRSDIRIDTDITDEGDDDILNEAIIVPQEVGEGDSFIRITLTGGGEFVYNMATATTFESGKKYKYIITANATGIGVASEITDWDGSADDVEGSVDM